MKIKFIAIYLVLIGLLTPLFFDAYTVFYKLKNETLELNSLTDADDSQEADGSEEKECEDFRISFENEQTGLGASKERNIYSYTSNFINKYNPFGIEYPPEIII
jgi:hypothetical protein